MSELDCAGVYNWLGTQEYTATKFADVMAVTR